MTVSKLYSKTDRNIQLAFLDYLSPIEVEVTAAVCKEWLLNSRNDRYWKAQCLKQTPELPNMKTGFKHHFWRVEYAQQNVPPDNTTAMTYARISLIGSYFVEEGDDPRESSTCWKVARLIGEYVPEFMEGCANKVRATILSAQLKFYDVSWVFQLMRKQENFLARRFGIDEDEPMACVRTLPDTSETIPKYRLRKWKEDLASKNINWLEHIPEFVGYGREWKEIPIAKDLKSFPGFIPLRCFFDRNGNCKNDGDPIYFSLEGRKIILILKRGLITWEGEKAQTNQEFVESCKEGIKTSMVNCMYLLDLARAKELAKTGPKWIPVE